MNQYEEKQAARKARYENRAASAQAQAGATHARVRAMADAIPFGQPILIGHHSEDADRRCRGRIEQGFRKSFELLDKAEHYEQKAAAVGKSGISSDDPDAVEKLTAKLASLSANQDFMKTANAVIRRHKGNEAAQIAALVEINGISDDAARQIVQPDFAGRVGFASYQLQNNNANMRRIAERIKDLARSASRERVERTVNGYTYREDPSENRAMFLFDAKPEKQSRDVLKRHGFRWSPSRNAWVRQLTGNAIYAAQAVSRWLDEERDQ